MSEQLTICNRCGNECTTITDDALDYCSDCGVVEGNTTVTSYDFDNENGSEASWDGQAA